jgi:hypothetical protein
VHELAEAAARHDSTEVFIGFGAHEGVHRYPCGTGRGRNTEAQRRDQDQRKQGRFK